MPEVSEITAKSILTAQHSGFLRSAPHPFTHTLSPYTGCGFGKTSCGQYCYAQELPAWQHFPASAQGWGGAVGVKVNAAALLREALPRLDRPALRIFCASSTDPYQPLEATYKVSQACLQAFSAYSDLDLLLIQTRSPLAERDFDVMQDIPYLYLSVSVETDDQHLVQQLGGGPLIEKRLALVRQAAALGLNVQIAVSPCLPHSADFAAKLLDSGARRFIVDTFTDGDGSRGVRTAQSTFAQQATYNWRDTGAARRLYEDLAAAGREMGWSAAGFCGIAPRPQPVLQPKLF